MRQPRSRGGWLSLPAGVGCLVVLAGVCAMSARAQDSNASAPGASGAHGRGAEDAAPAPGSFVPGRVLLKFKPGVSKENRGHVLARHKAKQTGRIPHIGVRI